MKAKIGKILDKEEIESNDSVQASYEKMKKKLLRQFYFKNPLASSTAQYNVDEEAAKLLQRKKIKKELDQAENEQSDDGEWEDIEEEERPSSSKGTKSKQSASSSSSFAASLAKKKKAKVVLPMKALSLIENDDSVQVSSGGKKRKPALTTMIKGWALNE